MKKRNLVDEILPPDLAYYQDTRRTRIFLASGEVVTAVEPSAVITILGPCVSICLFDRVQRIGGMNHFLLPWVPYGEKPSARYGDFACQMLIDNMINAGARPKHMVAKVFGGSEIIPFKKVQDGSIGKQNWQCALEHLQLGGISVIETDVGGCWARKVVFQTDNGSTFINKNESRGINEF